MADPQKVKVFDGTDWVDLKADDPNLPISSTDGTVTLDSPSANTFTVSTNGTARLYVRSDGNVGHGYAGQANVNFASYMGFGQSTVEEMGFLAAPKFDSQPSTSMVAFESQPEFGEGIKATKLAHFRANDARSTNKTLNVIQRGFYSNALTLSTVGNRGFEANENIEIGKENYAFVAGGTAPSYFNGDVQASKLVGATAPDTDASIELGAVFTIDANQYTPLSITNNQAGVLIRTINKDSRQYWHGQDDEGWSVCTRQVVDGTPQAIRSFGVTGDYEHPDWRVYSGGFQADSWLKSPSVSGLADNDASIALGAGVTINVSNQEFVFGGYDADYTGGTLCGLGPSSNYIWSKSASGFAIGSDRIAFNSNMSGGSTGCSWLMETDGAFVGATGSSIETSKISAGRNNIGDASIELGANVTVSTGAFYLNVGNPAKNITIGDNISGVAGGDGVYILSRSHDLAFSSNEIRFNSDWSGGASEPTWVMTEDSGFVGNNNFNYIKCGSISGTISDDAAIELDANCSFVSSGIFNFQFRNADQSFGSKINVGYNETSSTGFANIGVGGCYLYLRDSKRFGIGATGINFNANAAADATTYDWTMEPDGTFVANAGRGVEASYITAGRNNSAGSLATSPKIVLDGAGITAVNTDGSDYTPIQPNSLATKSYVDDEISQAIASNEGDTTIGSGTPTTETAPDSAPGSMLFDENFLWVKTNTVWKKIPLLGFSSTPTGPTLQLTQEQYDAIPVKDDNTLYVIVG